MGGLLALQNSFAEGRPGEAMRFHAPTEVTTRRKINLPWLEVFHEQMTSEQQ